MEGIARYEWLLIILLGLGGLVWELFSLRRSTRRYAEQQARKKDEPTA